MENISDNKNIKFWENVDELLHSVPSLESKLQQTKPVTVRMSKKSITKLSKGRLYDINTIDPNGKYKIMWNFLLSSGIFWSVSTIPFDIGFGNNRTKFYLDLTVTCICFVDIFINFNTAYIDNVTQGLVNDKLKIAKKYSQFWLWIDIISSIPFEFYEFASKNTANSLIRSILLIRVLKLFRMHTVVILPEALNLSRLVFDVVIMIHVIACYWYFTGTTAGNIYTTESSYNSTSNTTTYDTTTSIGSWANTFNVINANTLSQYVASLYWTCYTILTIGYGDIIPQTSQEKLYAMFVSLFGGAMFGSIIAKTLQLLENLKPEKKILKDKLNELRAYCLSLKLPIQLQIKLQAAYVHTLKSKTCSDEKKILDCLPVHLYQRLVYNVYAEELQIFDFFRSRREKTLVCSLLLLLKPLHVPMGKVITNENDLAEDIFFVFDGTVHHYTSVSNSNRNSVSGGGSSSRGLLLPLPLPSSTSNINNNSINNNDISGNHNDEDSNINNGNNIQQLLISDAFCGRSQVGYYFGDYEITSVIFRRITSYAATDCDLFTLDVHQLLLKNPTFSQSTKNEFESRKSQWNDMYNSENIDYTKTRGNKICFRTKQFLWENTGILNYSLKLRSNNSSGNSFMNYKIIFGIISPNSKFIVIWNGIIILSAMYILIIAPLEVVFIDSPTLAQNIINFIVDGIFIIDMIINFRTAYFDHSKSHISMHNLITDPKKIAIRYISTGFFYDLFSSFPFDVVIYILSAKSYLSALKFFRFIKLLRILKSVKFKKISKQIERTGYLPLYAIEGIMLLLLVGIMGHIIACVWWGISTAMSTEPWYALNSYCLFTDHSKIEEKYVAAMYWSYITLTTVGYGDITGTNVYERILAIIIMLFGGAFLGYVVASVSNLVNGFNLSSKYLESQLKQAYEFFVEQNIPYELTTSIINNLRSSLKSNGKFNEQNILCKLPRQLLQEISWHRNIQEIDHILLFKFIQSKYIKIKILNLMKFKIIDSKQFLFKRSSVHSSSTTTTTVEDDAMSSSDIYFIISGLVHFVKSKKHENISLASNSRDVPMNIHTTNNFNIRKFSDLDDNEEKIDNKINALRNGSFLRSFDIFSKKLTDTSPNMPTTSSHNNNKYKINCNENIEVILEDSESTNVTNGYTSGPSTGSTSTSVKSYFQSPTFDTFHKLTSPRGVPTTTTTRTSQYNSSEGIETPSKSNKLHNNNKNSNNNSHLNSSILTISSTPTKKSRSDSKSENNNTTVDKTNSKTHNIMEEDFEVVEELHSGDFYCSEAWMSDSNSAVTVGCSQNRERSHSAGNRSSDFLLLAKETTTVCILKKSELVLLLSDFPELYPLLQDAIKNSIDYQNRVFALRRAKMEIKNLMEKVRINFNQMTNAKSHLTSKRNSHPHPIVPYFSKSSVTSRLSTYINYDWLRRRNSSNISEPVEKKLEIEDDGDFTVENTTVTDFYESPWQDPSEISDEENEKEEEEEEDDEKEEGKK